MSYLKEVIGYSFAFGKDYTVSLGGFLLVIFALVATHFFLRLLRRIVCARLKQEDQYKFITLFTFLKYFIFTIVLIVSLDSIGIEVTVLLAGSTALFVGLGLGMQKLFQDITSGIFILLDRTVSVNDIIQVEGKVGKVTQVNLRTTRAITHDDKILIIPNHKFLSEILYNWTQNYEKTREFVEVGVAYGTDVDLVKEILIQVALDNRVVLRMPEPDVHFQDFGDSALQFRLYFYIADSFNILKIKSDIRFGIDKAFKEKNITIPFPQRDVHIHQK
ncbi:MAG: mechanosensitive ion channel [Flavobacteriaceae bacterium]|nr:mechanosensitive ion channel [Flavobacteriaceae bacterium]